uniref:Chitin-binding type-2 domain-containing protein n=1 Tax=Musca domestica TaxID=7370 RepID=A0A1I8NFF7_MUSDO
MKFVFCFALLACLIACGMCCDADSNNMPSCNTKNVNVPVRNFWDPTGYWECKSATGTAEMVHCPDAQLFDEAKGQCVAWNEWTWTNPCPAAN